jgi:hypothetical protein
MTLAVPPRHLRKDPALNRTAGGRQRPLQSGDETFSGLTNNANFKNDTDSLTFPWKLHSLLETAAKEGFDHIVSWLDNNASFKVHDPALFVKDIMPRFFKRQSQYKSFQRQLNVWQFERLLGSKGPCNGGYFHVFFHRHDTSLFHRMTRSKLRNPPLSPSLESCQEPFQDPKTSCATRESESTDFHQPCMSLSEQKTTTMMTPHAARSSVSTLEDLCIHGGFVVNLDTYQSQFPNMIVARESLPLTSSSPCLLPNPFFEQTEEQHDERSNQHSSRKWNDQDVLASLETMPAICISSSVDNDLDGDDQEELPSHGKKSDQGSTEFGGSSVLTAEDWRYVLVGMQIAMTE